MNKKQEERQAIVVPEINDKKKLQELYAEYNIPLSKEETSSAPTVSRSPQPKVSDSVHADDFPRKSDGTPYTLQEIQQIQAYRTAMRQKRNSTGENAVKHTDNLQSSRPSRTGNSQHPPHPSQSHTAPIQKQNTATMQSQNTVPMQKQNTVPMQKQNTASMQRENTVPVQKQNAAVPQYRRRKPNKPNPAALIFALLILVVSSVSIAQIIDNNRIPGQVTDHSSPGMVQRGDETLDILPGSETDSASGETGETTEQAPVVLWNTVQVSNQTLDEGNLILVNYAHTYADTDLISPMVLYGNKADSYQVSNSSISLLPVALHALDALANDFYAETGSREIIVVSGYRNVAAQQSIFDSRVASQGEEMARLYVAIPGYSEHHTGLAIDLSFYTTDGKSVAIEEHEFGSWIHEHCTDYGFVLRYPDDKIDITKIGYESWHYRYVGPAHAKIMAEKNMCFEEYIEYLRNYTTSTKLIWVQSDGTIAEVSPDAFPKEGTLIYYVPAAEGDTTDIQLPRGNIFNQYDISGNNVDGFIVTVYIG